MSFALDEVDATMGCWYAIEGERLCKVRMVHDRQHVDGTIRLTLPRSAGSATNQSGLFEVHDEHEGTVYFAQSLSCWFEYDAFVLSCTPLGLGMDYGTPRPGDCYLVLNGHEPLPITSYYEMQSQCPKGNHLRFEVASEAWDTLGLHAVSRPSCHCSSCACEPGSTDRQWHFKGIYQNPDSTDHPKAEIILLHRRERVAATIDLAHRCDQLTTIISHTKRRYGF